VDAHDPIESLHDAHEQAMRRIQELRDRDAAPSPSVPDLRTLLARAEGNVSELRGTAQELAALLPTRVEAAVARALGEDEGGIGRRLDEVRSEVFETAEAVDRIERDLLAERLGRVEDLEVLVDLLTGGIAAVRADVARLTRNVEALAARIDAPLHVTIDRPTDGYRTLFGAGHAGHAAGEASDGNGNTNGAPPKP
jgi:phage shock protein A